MRPTYEQLQTFLADEVVSLVEELGFPWNEIPGAIAKQAVMHLVFHGHRIGLPLDTTLREIGQVLEIIDADGNWT